ncbi:MAG: protein kinase [Vicinamibacteria bacterium]
MIGQTISHYHVVERLGGGGMGVVYKARDQKLDRFVALKFLSAHLLGSDTARRRFLAEARAASALDHPNIATVHAIEETTDGDVFIVMAHYEGQTLAQRIAAGPLPPAVAIDVAIQAGEGLARAHERGIVHRDVKPANLILASGGLVKVLDFGLAKVADLRLTDAGTTLGTPVYMSPEQTRGEAVDHRTDVWSLGVVLYEMLSGRLPFDGEDRQAVCDAILRGSPAPLRPLAGSPELPAVVSRALARSPGERYASMLDFVLALRLARGDDRDGSLLETAPQQQATTGVAPAPVPSSGERRQVTVLAAELADYLPLSMRLDPEELQEKVGAFRDAAIAAVRAFDGHVAAAEEGRVVAWFGYPVAHEDDAHRAARAARRALASDAGRGRAALHTGLVVVGDSRATGGVAPIVGNVPAIAARLLDAAPAGSVVASAETRRLLEGLFDLEAAGEHAVAGLAQPLPVFRVVRESGAQSRAEAARRAGRAPVVGRDHEIALVLQRFELAREGEGQAVLVVGEPGIGKSRLLLEVGDRVGSGDALRIELHGSPYFADDALHPVTASLARAAALDDAPSPEEGRTRLDAWLSPAGLDAETTDLLAAALSLPVAEASPIHRLAPQRRPARTLEAFAALALGLAARRPLLLVVEDAHWLDPTSLELLDRVVGACASAALLVLVSARPGFAPSWAQAEPVTRIPLGRLPRKHAQALVAGVSGASRLSPALVEQVLARTDGVPLFAEELTRALVEADHPSGAAIPATLQESLAARLDRLGGAKATAQLASVVGREFPLPWLEAVAPVEAPRLREELKRLVEAGLVQLRGAGAAATGAFKHALVQEAAYASLLKPARQQHHERLARVLEERFPQTAAAEPGLVARHWAEAGQALPAIAWWEKAAGQAASRFASREAAAAFRHALAQVEQLPAGPERFGRELQLQMGLCAALPSVAGFAAPEVAEAWARAKALCDGAGPVRELFWVHHGLWAYDVTTGRFVEALARAEQLAALAEGAPERILALDGAYARGVTLACLGRPAESLAALERAVAVDEADPGRAPVLVPGLEVGVCSAAFRATPLWLLGRPDEALARASDAARRARELGHPLTLAYALYYVAWARLLRGEAPEAVAVAQELCALSEEHALFFGALGGTLLGAALDAAGSGGAPWRAGLPLPPSSGLEAAAAGVAAYRAMGFRMNLPFGLGLLADAQARRGRLDEARATLAEALAEAAATGESWWAPELQRLRAEVALAAGDRASCEEALRAAVAAARAQGSVALERRAAEGLDRLG